MALGLLWEQCLAAFLQEKYARSQSEATVSAYRSMLNLFFGRLTKSPELVTHEDVVSFMLMPTCGRTQHGTPPSASTKNQRLQAVHLFYAFAARYKVIDGYGNPYRLFQGDNPAEGLRHSKVLRHPRALTDQEIHLFLSAIPTDTVIGLRDLAIFTLFLFTARRRSEIERLTWGDIEYGTVTTEQGQTRQAWLYHFTGKGMGGQKDVAELPEPAKECLDAYLQASGRLATIAPEDPLFLAVDRPMPHDPYQPLCGTAMETRMKQYARSAGLDSRHFTLHALRHTSAKARYEAEHDILKIMHLLRHRNLNTTFLYIQSLTITADDGAQILMRRYFAER